MRRLRHLGSYHIQRRPDEYGLPNHTRPQPCGISDVAQFRVEIDDTVSATFASNPVVDCLPDWLPVRAIRHVAIAAAYAQGVNRTEYDFQSR